MRRRRVALAARSNIKAAIAREDHRAPRLLFCHPGVTRYPSWHTPA